jgi:hypothetical protein
MIRYFEGALDQDSRKNLPLPRKLAFATICILAPGAVLIALSHFAPMTTGQEKSLYADAWGDEELPSPALGVSQKAQEKVLDQTKVELERLQREDVRRGPGGCKPGDRLEHLGGWAVGAAGVSYFSNPVEVMKKLVDAESDQQLRMVEASPLQVGRRGGCEGVGYLEPREAYLSQPLGGGAIEDGKFLVVTVDPGVPSSGCFLVVEAKDVTCVR